ncbi:MAG: phenylalanine--tRNA ligase subunit alpha [Lactobacillaceae bacterium]|jgi:phenylalanyl-tRNA synthetase alpha chain|nr:phenylalanine--tRNA ligase subunit alpha [Lactobacillaceae bacterium]
MDLIEKIENVKNKIPEIQSANLEELEKIRSLVLGKKGELTTLLRGLKEVDEKERGKVGSLANLVRTEIEEQIQVRTKALQKEIINQRLENEKIDVTLPGTKHRLGHMHVLQQIQNEIEDLFISQGYRVVYGNEIESDEYNFERMNLPKDHPARDMQDTFYIDSETLLRTQTSAMQARIMEKHDFSKGPLKMISPGLVYRRDDDDTSHSHQFHQIEGLVIDKNITLADLKGTLQMLIDSLFGQGHAIRLRPSYFPFTEPSIEVDVSWNKVDSSTEDSDIQWIEVLGAGMVHPKVLEMSGIDHNEYSGFAFGLGPDRFAMIKYEIDDIRNFYLNDLRFIEQFKQVKK